MMMLFLVTMGVIALFLVAYHVHMLRHDVGGVYRRLGSLCDVADRRLESLCDVAEAATDAFERIADTNEENTAMMRHDRSEEGVREGLLRARQAFDGEDQ